MAARHLPQVKTERVGLALTPKEIRALRIVARHKSLRGTGLVFRYMGLPQAMKLAERLRKNGARTS